MSTKYDSIVIGSGQGGNPLAFKLADAGRSVALIEPAYLGGTCVNTGCTPTKTMVASAQVAHYARQADRWGVRTSDVSVDLAAVVKRKNRVVENSRSGQQKRVDERPNLHLYRGKARFVAPHRISVNDETLEGTQIFIDTGARPSIPALPGLDSVDYLTNVTLLEITEAPEHLLVLGGGYVGLEFGQIFRRFGSEVTIIQSGPQILPREDPDVAGALQKCLKAEGIKFLLDTKAAGVEKNRERIVVNLEAGETSTVSGSHLLVATGRTPNTEDLDLKAAGIRTNAKGFIQVNSRLETNVENVWALGDVNGGPAFTHISYNDFQIVYANLMEGKNVSTGDRIVPYSVFTDPQLGRVGLTEADARKAGYRLKIGKYPMTSVARAIERDETAGMMKIVVDAATDRILGAAILAVEGGETVQILHTLMLAKQPYTLLKGAIYIHPTLAEGFFGLMEDVKAVN